MKIFGQSADYSEILQRVFWFSIGSGFVCTVILAKASPAVHSLIESISTNADLGPIKSVKVLYVMIPGAIAVVSRMIRLHDRISDFFKIRFTFDIKFFLYPLCQGAGVPLTDDLKAKIRKTRNDSMFQTVYKYAGFRNPVIDEQLVRTAADNWGWFWVLVESSFLFIVTAGIMVFLSKWNFVLFCLGVFLIEMILLIVQWFACKRSARRQVVEILKDHKRKTDIAMHFESL